MEICDISYIYNRESNKSIDVENGQFGFYDTKNITLISNNTLV